ncbi:MAG: CocE/NonD family hydrolase [Bacteroidota bacterium]
MRKKLLSYFIISAIFSVSILTEINAQKSGIEKEMNHFQPPKQDIETGGYIFFEEMIEGGDGFKLVTKIYLPEGEGPWPVVMTRTPYAFGKTEGDNLFQGRTYARQGLGYVQQYCRGKGGSEGFYLPYEYEREDGLTLVNWLAAQEWCKTIGIFGSSYTAFTGWIIADKLPEKVKGLYLQHYGVDRHISVYKDGLFRQDIMSGWAIDNAEENIVRPVKDRENPYYENYRYMPQIEMDVNMLGAELPWYRDWITHTDYKDQYWNQSYWYYLKKIPGKVKIPVTVVAGLYDHHLEGTLLAYTRLKKKTRTQSRLILGSWNHSFQITPTQHNPQHAKDLVINEDQFNWLYSVVAKNIVPEGNVQVYFIEEDRWLTFDTWPVKSENNKTYYFTGTRNSRNLKAYVLSSVNRTETEEIKYVYDPENPVISNGGETLFTSASKRGSKLQKEIGYRNDVISFVTEPLIHNLTLAGRITVKLNVSTDVDDTCFAFTVSEIMPDGSTYNIRSGITTLAYRNNPLGNRQAYIPNSIEEITIITLPVTWNIKAGNALRVDITSSNFPEYAIHSNYAGIWSLQTRTQTANQIIYTGGEYKSSISFPTIEIEKY